METVKHGFADLGPELPPAEEFLRGKALLQSMHGGGPGMHDENRDSDPTTGNLYEHLVSLLKLILEQKPTHSLDQFEELSRQVKRERGGGAGGSGAGAGLVTEDIEATSPTAKQETAAYLHAKVERTLLHHPKHKWDENVFSKSPLPASWGGYYDDDDEIQRLQNLGQTSFLVEQAGVGLGRSEMLRIWLSIRKLSLKLTAIAKLRFWGKIMGTNGSYYIAEGEFEAGMDPDNGVPGPFDEWRPYNPDAASEHKWDENVFSKSPLPASWGGYYDDDDEIQRLQNLGQTSFLVEQAGVGLGRSEMLRIWLSIRKLSLKLTAIAKLRFWGKIMGTNGSYYIAEGEFEAGMDPDNGVPGPFDEWRPYNPDAGEMVLSEQPETLMEVEEFEPPQFEELLDAANWQHTRPYILLQGRCSFVPQKRAAAILKESMEDPMEKGWINPTVAKAWVEKFKTQEESEEAMEEEGKEEAESELPQEGPGLLGTIEEDAVLIASGDVGLPTGRVTNPRGHQVKLHSRPLPSWKVHPSTVLLPKNCAVAIVSSGRWPGAYTLARGADFVNVYVGWGLKSLASSFSPMWCADPMKEFQEDAIPVLEATDPTPLEEEAVRAAKEARRLAREAKAEEAEDEEGDEEED
ncbi:hypothetical protein AHF37_00559 [Paragonimus kellicotti]|nr:hypothetical protein AHF37_00559 [Paragonimus kellicotti]